MKTTWIDSDTLVAWCMEKWEEYFPTPEQKINNAIEQLNQRQKVMNRHLLRTTLEKEDMKKKCTQYATEGNENELRNVARQMVTLEKKYNNYQQQCNKLSKIKEYMESVVNDQVCNTAILDIMQATTINSVDPIHARIIATQFSMNKTVASTVREILEDELDDSDEEEFTTEDEQHVVDLMKTSKDEVNQKIMAQIPPLVGTDFMSILNMNDNQLKEQHIKNQQQTNQFLSQKQHS
jgi:hypothetical protein